MVKPKIIQLEKTSEFATAMAAHNETIDYGYTTPKIKVKQISKLGHDAFVELTKYDRFDDKDIKFITQIANSLGGNVEFKQTGEINVRF